MRRHEIRLRSFDYRSPGIYLVALVTDRRVHSLANVMREEVVLSAFGEVVERHLGLLSSWRPGVQVVDRMIMPDHVHVILRFDDVIPAGLGGVIGCLKGGITREINLMRRAEGAPFWQQNYWERVLRSGEELSRYRRYLVDNPRRWCERYGLS